MGEDLRLNGQSLPLLLQNVLAGLFLRIPVTTPLPGQRVMTGIDARDARCHWVLRKTPRLNCSFYVSPVCAPQHCLGLLPVEDVPAGEDYRQVAFVALVPERDELLLLIAQ